MDLFIDLSLRRIMEHSLIRMNGIIVGDEYDSRTHVGVCSLCDERGVFANTIVDRCSDGVRWCQFQFIFFFALDRRYLRRNVGLVSRLFRDSEQRTQRSFIFILFIVEQTTWLQHLVEVLSSTKASPSFRSRRRRGLCGRE